MRPQSLVDLALIRRTSEQMAMERVEHDKEVRICQTCFRGKVERRNSWRCERCISASIRAQNATPGARRARAEYKKRRRSLLRRYEEGEL